MTTVLHVAEVLKGGMASYLDELLRDQVAIYGAAKLCLLIPASQVDTLSEAANVEIVTFDDGSRVRNIWAIQQVLRKLLGRRRFDLIHIHGTFAGVAVRAMPFWPGVRPPLVYCAHGWAFDRQAAPWKCTLAGWVEKLLAWRCERIICISGHDQRTALERGLPPSRLVTIMSGIADILPAPKVVAWPATRLRILFAGRFDRQKGVDILYGALEQLGSEYGAIVIGDSSVGDWSGRAAPPNVVETGWLAREQVQAYLQTCDVFVMPSRWEGFGLAAVEAMRAGRAVVAARVGALPELVVPGENGELVEPDSVESLQSILRRLDSATVAAMGVAGRRRFESHFNAQRMNQETRALYDTLLNGVRAPA